MSGILSMKHPFLAPIAEASPNVFCWGYSGKREIASKKKRNTLIKMFPFIRELCGWNIFVDYLNNPTGSG